MRIQETAGGTAIWNFFRMSLFRNGIEIERSEQGANVIRDAGYRDIDARSMTDVSVIARNNASDFDDVELVLRFIDTKDGRAFERTLDLSSFNGILIDLTPAIIPRGATFAILEGPGK